MKHLSLCGWVGLFAAGSCAVLSVQGAETIRFNRDVRPILADNCFACHGPDTSKRKAGLRFDTKDGLFEKTDKHEPAVVPGKLAHSELWSRITTTNLDDRMPPEDSHKELKPEQIAMLKKWILAGAPWEGHWAFIKPERPAVPVIKDAKLKIQNPIDSFVFAKLAEKGLKPNPEADKRTLVRRLFLDLTGLPPKPAELNAFLNDRAPDAYDKLVKHLLASPSYGEHRARYWLDAARYADTHGLHFDNYREMWPYRDWVIKAFNANVRFNKFTIDQIAGDLLPNPTDDQEVATGFQRCTMTTNEGGTIEDENLANYANDRVSTLSWVYLGMTMNCAACHDHKFDPITQKDFYSMAAFFRNTKQTGFDKNWRESDLFRVVPQSDAERARWRALPAEVESARKAREEQARTADPLFTNWLAEVKAETLPKNIELSGLYVGLPLTDFTGESAKGNLNGQPASFAAVGDFKSTTNGLFTGAPIITKSNGITLGDVGDFESGEPFTISAWVRLPKDFKGEGSVVARMAPEKENYRGWDFFVKDEEFGMYFVNRWSPVAMKVSSTAKSVKRGEWQHLCMTYDGSGRAPGARLYVNGVESKTDRDNNRLEGSIRTPYPARIGRREKGSELNNVAVADVRIFRQRLSSSEVRAMTAAPRVAELVEKANAEPTNAAPQELLRDYFRVTQHDGWKQSHGKLAKLEHEQQTIRGRSPVTLIQEEKTNSMPMAQVLFRGLYDKPKDKVTAEVPGFLHRMPSSAPTNRFGLAQWIVSPENPLTARVTVNRFWQEVFGIGLVKTAEDFGTTGDSPVNQELLDWLAIEFQESGWDVKRIFELMVTSSTYRQSAETTKEKLEKDPANRLLSRGPRFRMDAEALRDFALASSDLLVGKIGGPSVKPYQPDGIWEAVAMPESNTRHYTRDKGENLYRRSLYTFWKRAAPPATMDIFNAPSREVCSVRRERTNTPLQALATLNDPQFVEASRHLAEIAVANARKDEDAVQSIAERVLSRPLTSKELSIVKGTLKEAQSFYAKDAEAAKQLISVGESKPNDKIPAAQLAAMTMVANQLMNLDEALNK